jgi:hypothetical protein
VKPGDAWTTTTVIHAAMGEGEGQMKTEMRMVADVKITAVDGEETSYTTTFGEATMTAEVLDKKKTEPLPVASHSYVVKRRQGKVTAATREDGAKVTQDELDWLDRDVDSPAFWSIPKRPLKPGETITELSGRKTHVEDGQTVSSNVTVELLSVDGDRAIVESTITTEGLPTHHTCRATIRIEDGRPLKNECRMSVDGKTGSDAPGATTTVAYSYR